MRPASSTSCTSELTHGNWPRYSSLTLSPRTVVPKPRTLLARLGLQVSGHWLAGLGGLKQGVSLGHPPLSIKQVQQLKQHCLAPPECRWQNVCQE